MEATILKLHERSNDLGSLVFLEALKDIPFQVKRVYYIYNVGVSVRRGIHAHKKLRQVLICVHGSCKVMLDDGKEKIDVQLDDPTEGLLVDRMIWREMYDFSHDAVLLVLASEYYDIADYIFEYDEFLRVIDEVEVELS